MIASEEAWLTRQRILLLFAAGGGGLVVFVVGILVTGAYKVGKHTTTRDTYKQAEHQCAESEEALE